MSDLEQSEIKNMSDDEMSIYSQEINTQPIVSNKQKSINKFDDDIVDDEVDEDGVDDEVVDDDVVDDDVVDDDVIDDDIDDVDDIDDDDDNDNDNDNDNNDDIVNNNKIITKTSKINKNKTNDISSFSNIIIPNNIEKNDSDYDSDEDEDEDEDYLQKFDNEIREKYIQQQHPESIVHNYNEIYNMSKVTRNKDNIIIDELHKTIPILTKFEKTRVLGIRAKQINNGAKVLTNIPSNVMDGYLIALKELEEKVIPIIIRRPLPNGGSEYWRIKDLEII